MNMSEPSEPQIAAIDDASSPKIRKASRWRKPLVLTLALLAAVGGAVYILAPKGSASTDNAYVKADASVIASQVRGRIVQVLVRDNQRVKAGDPLLRIDAEEFDARTSLARAEMEHAKAAVESAKAAVLSLDAEERLAESNTRAVVTAIDAATAQRTRAASDQARYENLARTGAVAQREAELARTATVVAQAEADRSRAALEVSRNQVALTRSKRHALKATLAQAEAGVASSQARLALAQQDQNHAAILAPVDGVVGGLQARVGDFVQPALRLMTVMPLDQLYVLAYFKETQTARMDVGRPARIEVDALPGLVLAGTVDSLAPGTGSEFALLPYEPGTGNFTKIVQRVPVRVRVNDGQAAGLAKLRPGLSATVTVSFAP